MPVVPAAGYPTGPEAPPQVPLDVPDDYSRVRATPESFGAQVGQSMSALGRVLTTSADQFQQVAIERQQLHNKVVSDNQINNFNDKANNLLYGDPNAPPGTPEAIGFYGLRGQAAIDAYPKIRAALQASREQMRGSLENPMQQILFDQETRRQMSLEMGRAGAHYDQQYDVFQSDTNKASAAAAQQRMDRAALANDDIAFNASVKDAMDAGMKQLQAAGEDKNPDAVNAMLSRVRTDAVERRIKGYIGTGNTDAAAAVLAREAGPDGALSVEQAAAYRKILDGIEADRAAHRALQPEPSQPNASKNLENFNFGNMKAAGGGWRVFASEEEGVKAIGDWLLRHNQAGQTTIRQLIDDPQRGYAPSADPGNAGKGLPEAAARIVGVGPDQPIDMNDPVLRRKMVGAIVQQEFANPQITQRALAAYDRAQQGTTAAAPGSGLPAGTIDKTADAGFGTKFGPLEKPQGMIIHNTEGGDNDTVDDVIKTFKQTNYPAQFVIDRQGKIYQILPDGYRGQHIRDSYGPLGTGKTNANMEGVEIIANKDGDVLPVQEEAAARLVAARAQKWGYDPRTSVFGHGEVNPGHRKADEGMGTVTRIRNGTLSVAPPSAAAAPSGAQPAAAAAAPGTIEVWGDSLGVGLKGALRAKGNAVGGAQPTAILADIKAQPENSWAGKTVVLSSGSNGRQMDKVEETIKYLQAHNANVVVVGYGSDPKASLPEKNAQLREIAGRLKVPVVDAEEVGPDGIHPSPQGYRSMGEKIRSAQSAATQTKPATAGEGAIVTGPNGERLQNKGGKWVDLTTGRPYEQQSAGP